MVLFHIKIKNLEKRLDKIERYPRRVLAVLIGLFTMFNAMTMQVTSPYNSFGILWCSLIVLGFSGGLILWGICSDFEW